MKGRHFVPPLLAVLLAVLALGVQRRHAAALRDGNELLRERIALAGGDVGPGKPTGRPGSRIMPQEGSIHWANLAESIRLSGPGPAAGVVSIQRRLLRMEIPELLAALDEIDGLELDAGTRSSMELLVLDPLVRKDPQAALERFKDRLGEPGFAGHLLAQAMKRWAEEDLDGAAAWLDRGIQEGRFEPRSLSGIDSPRARFEVAVVFGLFGRDPAAAEKRLSRMPAAARAEVLRMADSQREMRTGDEIELAAIIRRQLDDAGRTSLIGQRAGAVMRRGGDFAAVDDYLERVDAAPDERERGVEEAVRQFQQARSTAGSFDAAAIDEMRGWLTGSAPEAADRLTGTALGRAVVDGMDFSEAAGLVRGYREGAGGDATLVHFLRSLPVGAHRTGVLELIGELADPAEQRALRERWEAP